MNVYDFDNTIYDGESGVDLFLFFLKKDPSLLLKLPWAIKLIIDYKLTKIPIKDIVEKHSKKIEAYGAKKVGDLDELAVAFWDKYCVKIKSFYITNRTDNDVIVTANLDFIMEEFCRRFGVEKCIASEVDRERKLLKFFCYKENKLTAFRAAYPGERIENLYTDSFNDQPLMDVADNVFLVKGSKITKIK